MNNHKNDFQKVYDNFILNQDFVLGSFYTMDKELCFQHSTILKCVKGEIIIVSQLNENIDKTILVLEFLGLKVKKESFQIAINGMTWDGKNTNINLFL